MSRVVVLVTTCTPLVVILRSPRSNSRVCQPMSATDPFLTMNSRRFEGFCEGAK